MKIQTATVAMRVLLAVLLAVSLTACGKKPPEEIPPSPTPTPAPRIIRVPASIIFVSRHENRNGIWSIGPNAKNPELMLAWAEELRFPTWSRDGKQIAFFGKSKGIWGLYVMDPVTKKPFKLTFQDDLNAVAPPQWSPDGKQVAYLHKGIWLVRTDGSNPTTLIGDPTIKEMAWSPDGRSFAMTRDHYDETCLWSVQIDGTNLIRLSNRNESRTPSWAPDSKRLAFTVIQDKFNWNIWVVRADGTEAHPITMDDQSYAPIWCPEPGVRKIAFLSGAFVPPSLWVMDEDGDKRVELSDKISINPKIAKSPMAWAHTWAPDGSQIAFAMGILAKPDVFTIAVDGTKPRQASASMGWDPSWGCLETISTAVIAPTPAPRALTTTATTVTTPKPVTSTAKPTAPSSVTGTAKPALPAPAKKP